jgi:hypothetical protein
MFTVLLLFAASTSFMLEFGAILETAFGHAGIRNRFLIISSFTLSFLVSPHSVPALFSTYIIHSFLVDAAPCCDLSLRFLSLSPFLWFAPLHGFIPTAFSSPCCTMILLFPYYSSLLLSWFWSCLSGCSCTLFYSCLIFLNRLQCLHHCSLLFQITAEGGESR